jgi:predicted ArsR family transcriptional regulator
MSQVRVTTKETADRLGISYVVAAGLIAHLESVGKAVVVDKIRHESGKGKPTRVYLIDSDVSLDFNKVAPVAVAAPVDVVEDDEVDEDRVANEDSVEEALKRLKEAV